MSGAASFWDRRRAGVEAEAEAEQRGAEEAAAAAKADELAARDDAEVLEELGLPDPASMGAGDDFTGFMSRDVPEHLRRVALRALWRSNPVLANVDGLNEYDDDYRAAMLLQEPVKTAYQVGKGMKRHIEEMERQARLAEEGPVEDETVDDADVPAADAASAEPEVVAGVTGDTVGAESAEAVFEGEAEEDTPAPRRMRFHFEEETV